MKLEPVYLLAPEPDLRIKLSRRAFGATIFGSCVLGAGLGVGAIRLWDSCETEPESEAEGIREGDALLVWARGIAAGTITGLVENAHGFMFVLADNPDDPPLWHGLTRLAEHVVRDLSATAPEEGRTAPITDPSIAPAVLHYLEVPPIELAEPDPAELRQLRDALRKIVR